MNSVALCLLVVVAAALWLSDCSAPDPTRSFRIGGLEGVTLLTMAMLAVLAVSFISTWFVWETQISERAFHCTEEGCLSIGFWMSPETHQAAGDTIMPGWTWEKVAVVRRLYQAAFLTLSLAGAVAAFRVWKLDAEPC